MAETASQSMLSSFSVSEALSGGWKFFQSHVGQIVTVGVVYLLASAVPSAILQMIAGENATLSSALSLVLNLWTMYLSLGMTRYMLALIRGGNPELSMMFNNSDGYVNYVIMNIRYSIVIIGGMLLLIVPGIYFAIKYAFTLMLVADGKSNGSEAFKMSAAMTEGRRFDLFAYGIVSAVIVFIGFIALIIPGIVAAAVSGIGMVLLYEYALANMKK